MWRRVMAVMTAVFAFVMMASAAQASLSVSVDLSTQRMQVRTSDGESYNWAISSGREGYRTIRGNFKPYRLEKKWYSRKYGGNMPNAVFFRGGFAIHGTGAVGMLGRPASHGCVRLHPSNAAKLFALVQKHGKGGTRIAINGVAPDSNTRYAKAKKPAKTQVAAKPRRGTDWNTARNRVLERETFQPGSALGFQPIRRGVADPDAWMLRR
jgi:hypothetical protein